MFKKQINNQEKERDSIYLDGKLIKQNMAVPGQ